MAIAAGERAGAVGAASTGIGAGEATSDAGSAGDPPTASIVKAAKHIGTDEIAIGE